VSVAQRIHDEVALHLPAVALPLLRYAVARSGDDPTVEDAAANLGVDRKTLVNWLRTCGTVRPFEFIAWIRLAIAAGMLEDPGKTIEQVALDAGFSSAAAFRNMLRRYTDLSCSDIRMEGGLARVLARFLLELTPETERDVPSAMPMPEAELHVPAQHRGA
jgi:AraC-like DNA-binding protein